MKPRFLTYEQAVELLPAGETIHTFYNVPFGLIGADWERSEVLDKLKKSGILELTGPGARGMGHGLAVYNRGDRLDSILFVETDAEKLDALDPEGGADD